MYMTVVCDQRLFVTYIDAKKNIFRRPLTGTLAPLLPSACSLHLLLPCLSSTSSSTAPTCPLSMLSQMQNPFTSFSPYNDHFVSTGSSSRSLGTHQPPFPVESCLFAIGCMSGVVYPQNLDFTFRSPSRAVHCDIFSAGCNSSAVLAASCNFPRGLALSSEENRALPPSQLRLGAGRDSAGTLGSFCSDLTCRPRGLRGSKESSEVQVSRREVLGISEEQERGREMSTGSTTTSVMEGEASVGLLEGGLSKELAEEIIQEALTWATLHGLVVGDKTVKRSGTCAGVGVEHVPLALLPTPFPQQAFTKALELATYFNTLVDRVSQDTEFLQQALARTVKADSFTARLMNIHLQVLEEGIKQEIQLGLHRSDYMLDMATGALLQVELNTISSSFAALGTLTSQVHRYLTKRFSSSLGLDAEKVPENNATDAFVEGLALAWREYGDKSAAVLMVVHEEETNMYDQHWLSFKLYEFYGLKMIRRTLKEVNAQASLGENGILLLGDQVIAVVYYRSGYSPDDYGSEEDWSARLLMERSAAVKCPSISYHLVGAKKIQQELAMPGVLERFLQDESGILRIRECFAGLWSLEGEGSERILEEAVVKPEGFVLKPQREGGGNNIYGADVATAITKLKQEEDGAGLAAYILMQRIFPAVNTSYLIRDGLWITASTISELGIFGTYLRNGKKEVLNKQGGHLVRTKVANSNEGGVAAGYGVLDSPYLT